MAGAIADGAGRILVARRPEHVHQGGLWEFPGGKLEPGERPEQGLKRELWEELGIEVRASRPLIRIHHDYGDRHILLDVHRVEAYAGTPVGREGQPLAWEHPETMDSARFPEADRPIINALRLPDRLMITGEDPGQPSGFLSSLEQAIAGGIRLVQLRAHGLSDAAFRSLVSDAYAVCERAGARLLLNRDPGAVCRLPRHGIHLTSVRLMRLSARPVGVDELVGASCHDLPQLARAAELGLDYAVLSPVKPTESHPDAAPLGWEGFERLVDQAGLPVYALGGLAPSDCTEAFARGGQGIAAIRGLWPA